MKKINTKQSIHKLENAAFTTYLKDINRIPQINYSHEEEIEIINSIKNGDYLLREQFINNNLRYVVTVAKNFQQKNEDLLDLIMEGNCGLIKALDKFDVNKETRFLTYATFWIRQSILIYLHNYNTLIKMNPQFNNELKEVKQIKLKLEQQLEREPTNAEILEHIEISENKLKRIEELSSFQPTNLDAYFDIADEPSTKENEEEIRWKIKNVLGLLTFKEKLILELYFGINCDRKPLQLISQELNLSKERVRLLKQSGLNRIKNIIETKNYSFN